MKQRRAIAFSGGAAVVAVLLWWRLFQGADVPADATVKSRGDAVACLKRLLKENPKQIEFAIRWRVSDDSKNSWSAVKYNRVASTLTYIPTYRKKLAPAFVIVAHPPFIVSGTVVNSGCPSEPSCRNVPESAILSAKDVDALEDIMNKAGCQAQIGCMLTA